MSEELAGILQLPEPVVEKRQCVTKTLAGGILWREKGRRPSLEEVEVKAQELLDRHELGSLLLQKGHGGIEPFSFFDIAATFSSSSPSFLHFAPSTLLLLWC